MWASFAYWAWVTVSDVQEELDSGDVWAIEFADVDRYMGVILFGAGEV